MYNATLLCIAIIAGNSEGFAQLSNPRIRVACEQAENLIVSAEKHNIDPYILAGLVYVESRWKATAVSSANACGLTQVIPRYVPETCRDLKDPVTSLDVGARSLRMWLSDTHVWGLTKPNVRTLTDALACYNVGTRCSKLRVGRQYSAQVQRIANGYRQWIKKNVHDFFISNCF